jgi:hypothetical protein
MNYNYIINKLKELKICEYDISKKELILLKTNRILSIINNGNDGIYMNGFTCALNKCISNLSKNKKEGLVIYNNNIDNIITIKKSIDKNIKDIILFKSDYTKEQVEAELNIKEYKDNNELKNIIIDYFINLYILSKIKNKIPTIKSVYCGLILNNENIIYVINQKYNNILNLKDLLVTEKTYITEKSELSKLPDFLKNIEKKEKVISKITTTEFLEIFIQILFTLEIAQDEYKYCNYAIEPENISVNLNVNNYSFTYDNNNYTIKPTKYIPIIINSKYTYCKYDDENIYPYYINNDEGIIKTCVPGYDMYNFLYKSLQLCKDNKKLYKYIEGLFVFYKSNTDNILVLEKLITNNKYKYTYSNIGKYTPYMFLNWLSTNYKYKEIYNKIVYKENFTNFNKNTTYSYNIKTTQEIYSFLIEDDSYFNKILNEQIDKCIMIDNNSYILNKLIIVLLDKYKTKINKKIEKITINNIYKNELYSILNKINKKLLDINNNIKNINIDDEYNNLLLYNNINIPDLKNIKNIYNDILNLNFNIKIEKTKLIKLITRYNENKKFYNIMNLYINKMNTIYYLNLLNTNKNKINNKYKILLQTFEKSLQYNIYSYTYIKYKTMSRYLESYVTNYNI